MTRRALLFCLLASGAAAAGITWDPIPPAELAAKASPLEADAPAEAIFRRIRIDDSGFPDTRKYFEYDRYRIANPERAANLTRLDFRNLTGMVIGARLTLPNGTTHVFGKESLKERTTVRNARQQTWLTRLLGDSAELRESYLAIPGVETGAILEFQIIRTEERPGPLLALPLQLPDVPIRSFELNFKTVTGAGYSVRQFTLNGTAAHAQSVTGADHRSIHLTAVNVPGLRSEPFSGPIGDYEFMFVAAYRLQEETMLTHHGSGESYRYDPRKTPWAARATEFYFLENDRTQVSRGLKATAAQIVGSATTEEGKARAIHDFVQAQYQKFAHTPRTFVLPTLDNTASSPEDVLRWEKHPNYFFNQLDFVWLEVGLDRAAGLTAQTLLLPNRGFMNFSPGLVADAFLPTLGVRVQVDGKWRFSLPNTANPFAFGTLPWEQSGQVGLLAAPGKQEFVDVPLAPASWSQITHDGTFTLAADGTLSGEGTYTLTGYPAAIARGHIRRRTPASQKSYFSARLTAELKGAEVKTDSVDNAGAPEKPLIAHFHLEWPEFAVQTRTRLIFKPGVFHFSQQSPFESSDRRYNFNFPYNWTESDKIVITPPAGYTVETKQAPNSIPGDALDYRLSIAQEAASGRIHYSRTFTSNVLQAPASAAAALRRWYDAVAVRDQYELVFAKQAAGPKVDSGEAP